MAKSLLTLGQIEDMAKVVQIKKYHLGESEHVEVGHMVLVGMADSLSTFLQIDQFSYVLHHKISLQFKHKQTHAHTSILTRKLHF